MLILPSSKAKALGLHCQIQSQLLSASPEKGKGTYHSFSRWRRGHSPGKVLSPAQHSRKLGVGGVTKKRERRAQLWCPHPTPRAARPAQAAKSNSYPEPRS